MTEFAFPIRIYLAENSVQQSPLVRVQRTFAQEMVHRLRFGRTADAFICVFYYSELLTGGIEGVASQHHLGSKSHLAWCTNMCVKGRRYDGFIQLESGFVFIPVSLCYPVYGSFDFGLRYRVGDTFQGVHVHKLLIGKF